jgi:hypothetical protein
MEGEIIAIVSVSSIIAEVHNSAEVWVAKPSMQPRIVELQVNQDRKYT